MSEPGRLGPSLFALTLALVSALAGASAARETNKAETSTTLRLVGTHRYQKPALGGLNPQNAVFELPRQISEIEARFDFSFAWDPVSFFAKPRARWTREQWQDGLLSGESDTDTDAILLEGAAKLRAFDSLFLSFGRENLQWGPAQLVSPSNPFFPENGRANPQREIPGMDFFRAVWIPSRRWTVSGIANTGRGEGDLGGWEWHPSQALKVDYTGYTATAGILLHRGSDTATSLRGYGQWTVSDAALVYCEASASQGTRVLYPVRDLGPLGGHLEATRENDPNIFLFALVGGSYTLELGPTVSLEYVYNGEGYSESDADRFFEIGSRLAEQVSQGTIISPPASPGTTGLRLLRRHYLSVQYLQTEIANRLSVICRWTQNIADKSALITAFAEYGLSDRWRLFVFSGAGTGGNQSEFGSTVRYSATLGVEFSAF